MVSLHKQLVIKKHLQCNSSYSDGRHQWTCINFIACETATREVLLTSLQPSKPAKTVDPQVVLLISCCTALVNVFIMTEQACRMACVVGEVSTPLVVLHIR